MARAKSDNLLAPHPEGALLLWATEGVDISGLEQMADAADLAAVEGLKGARRTERLMWRVLARRLIDNRPLEVEYTTEGAPHVKNFPYAHISVSHCREAVAVVASNSRCGVDIESLNRNFRRIAPRYISPEEWALKPDGISAEDEQLFMAAVWCAKECLFKMYGRRGLNFCHDITIDRLDLCRKEAVGRVERHRRVKMKIKLQGDYIVVYHK